MLRSHRLLALIGQTVRIQGQARPGQAGQIAPQVGLCVWSQHTALSSSLMAGMRGVRACQGRAGGDGSAAA